MPFEIAFFSHMAYSQWKNGLPNSGPFYDVTSSTLKHTLLSQSGFVDTDDVRTFISCLVTELKTVLRGLIFWRFYLYRQ